MGSNFQNEKYWLGGRSVLETVFVRLPDVLASGDRPLLGRSVWPD
jgi:hypothetical protein